MVDKRKCPECGDPIYGRIDKKFCSDQCRNNFNNKQKGYSNGYVRSVNSVLRKNRKILEELAPNGKSKTHIKKLEKLEFDFKYFTNINTTKAGKRYVFCYEYGYLKLEDGFYLVVKNETDKK